MFSDTPDVIERSSPYGRTMAITTYKDLDGKRHQHSRTIDVREEHHQLGSAERKRREVARAVQAVRLRNHVPAPKGSDADAEENAVEGVE